MATNNLRLGSETPANYYVGSEAVSRIYFGSELVFDPVIIFGAPDFTSTTTGSIAPGTLYQAAHGLSSTPDLVLVEFVCLVANNGWAVGDTIPWHGLTIDQNIGSIGEGGEIIGRNSTNVFCQTGANYSAMPSKGGSPVGSYATSSWGIRFKVWENVEKVVSSDLGAAVGDTAYTFAHGLGSGTYYVTTEYTCVIAEDGYSVGDIIENQSYLINSGNGTDVSRSHSVGYNDTDAWDLIASANYLNKGTGQNAGAPTNANWEMRIVVFDLGTPDFVSGDLSWALSSNTFVNHSLATIDYMLGEFVCTTADENWAIGDKMPINHQAWDRATDDNNHRGSTVGYLLATTAAGIVLDAGAYTYGSGQTAAFSYNTYDPVNDKYLIVSRNNNTATDFLYHATWNGTTLSIGTQASYARAVLAQGGGVKWHDIQGYAVVSLATTLGFYAVDTSGATPVAPAGSVPSLVASRTSMDFDIKQSTGEISFIYINSGASTQIQGRILSLDASGNLTMTPTGGTDRVIVTTGAAQNTFDNRYFGWCYASGPDRWYLVYDNNASTSSTGSPALRIVDVTLSGSTFTAGTPVALPNTNFTGNLNQGGIDLAYDSVNDVVVVVAGVRDTAASSATRSMYGWIVDVSGGTPSTSNDLLIHDDGGAATGNEKYADPKIEFCSNTENFHVGVRDTSGTGSLGTGRHIISFGLNAGLTAFESITTNTAYNSVSSSVSMNPSTNAEDNGNFLFTTVSGAAAGSTGQAKMLEDSTADGEFYLSMPATYNMINLDKNTPTGTTGAVMNPARWRMRFSGWGSTI